MLNEDTSISHSEAFGLFGEGRRQFLTTLIASGFALAVQPIRAGTILTDTSGLITDTAHIDVMGGRLPAYYAKPSVSHGALPVVIVTQEIFGVHEHIQDICRRLAKVGYLAIAPELYFRQGDPRQYSSVPEIMEKVVSKVADQQVLSDIDATIKWAGTHNGNSKNIFITGFCWGGRIVWLYAAHNPSIKAGVAWYGRLKSDLTANTPQHPIDIASALKVPVLGLYGGLDKGISQESIKEMQHQLGDHSPSKIIVYSDAEHGFNADYRPSYNEKAAKDGWEKMLAWFHKYQS